MQVHQMIHNHLQSTYKELTDLDSIDYFFKELFIANTTNNFDNISSASINMLIETYINNLSISSEMKNDFLLSIYESKNYNEIAKKIFSKDLMFPVNQSIILTKSARYTSSSSHSHDYFEITCVITGTVKYSSSNQEKVLNSGDLVIIPPNTTHKLDLPNDSTVINIGIKENFIKDSFHQLLSERYSLSKYLIKTIYYDDFNYPLFISCGTDEYWINTMLWMYKQNADNMNCSNQIIENSLLSAMYYLIQNYSSSITTLSKDTELVRMQQIYQYIKANFQSTRLVDVAQIFSITPQYLSKIISHHFGKPFSKLVKDIKMQNAAELLKNRDLKIIEICQMVGYSDESHFIKCFKEYFDKTPKQYQIYINRVKI